MCFILILNMYHGVVGNGKVETCARDTCAVRHRGRYGTCVRGRAAKSAVRGALDVCQVIF